MKSLRRALAFAVAFSFLVGGLPSGPTASAQTEPSPSPSESPTTEPSQNPEPSGSHTPSPNPGSSPPSSNDAGGSEEPTPSEASDRHAVPDSENTGADAPRGSESVDDPGESEAPSSAGVVLAEAVSGSDPSTGGVLALTSIDGIDPDGGALVIDEGETAQEVVFYSGVDPASVLITGIYRLDPASHAKGASVGEPSCDFDPKINGVCRNVLDTLAELIGPISLCDAQDCIDAVRAVVDEVVDDIFGAICPRSGATPECLAELSRAITDVIDAACDDRSSGEQGAIECVNMAVELVSYYDSVLRDELCYDAAWAACAQQIANNQVTFIMGIVDSVCDDDIYGTSGANECLPMAQALIDEAVENLCTDDRYGEQGAIECVNMAVELVTYYETVIRNEVCSHESWTTCANRIADNQVALIMGLIDDVCNDDIYGTSGANECLPMAQALIDEAVENLCTDDRYGEQGAIECVNMAVELVTYYETVIRNEVCSHESWTTCANRIADNQIAFVRGLINTIMTTLCQSNDPLICSSNLIDRIDDTLGTVCGLVPVTSAGDTDGIPQGAAECATKVVGTVALVMTTVCDSTVAATCVENLIDQINLTLTKTCALVPVEDGGASLAGDIPPGVAACVLKVVGGFELALEAAQEACSSVPIPDGDGTAPGLPSEVATCLIKMLDTIQFVMESVCASTSATVCADTPSESGDELGLRFNGALLEWNDVGADFYRVIDPYEHINAMTVRNVFPHPALATGDNFSLEVIAIKNGQVIGVERLRGSSIARSSSLNLLPPTVPQGTELLSAAIVRTTRSKVEIDLPAALSRVIDSWSVYRNETLIATNSPDELQVVDFHEAEAQASLNYTIQVSAPNWNSPVDNLAWSPVLPAPCLDSSTGECSLPADSTSVDTTSPLAKIQAQAAPSYETPTEVSGDLLAFSVPVEIPEIVDPGPVWGMAYTASLPDGNVDASDEYWTGPRVDDSVVYFRTFIPMKYIDTPECPPQCHPWATNIAFGGDDRDFAISSLKGSTRTRVTVRTDWEGREYRWRSAVSPTKRYIIQDDGSKKHESTRQGVNNPTIQIFPHSPSRLRFRVRHSSENPYQEYYPAIDYEWEYVVTRDGGITARGLHDGAPNYEIFYRAPFSDAMTRVYTHRYTSFWSLSPPMDQKDRRWCRPSGACPKFGTARWV